MKNQPQLIYGVVLCGGTLAYILLVFLPNQTEIADLKTQIKVKQSFFLQTEQLTEDIEKARQQLKRAQFYNLRWTSSGVENSEYNSIIQEITNSINQAGTRILRFEPQDTVSMEFLRKDSVSLECEGSFGEIFQMVQNIEGLSSVIWMENLKIETSENKSDNLLAKLKLEIFADNRDISN